MLSTCTCSHACTFYRRIFHQVAEHTDMVDDDSIPFLISIIQCFYHIYTFWKPTVATLLLNM